MIKYIKWGVKMNDRNLKFIELMNTLNIDVIDELSNGEIEEVKVLTNSMVFQFTFRFEKVISINSLRELINKLENEFVGKGIVKRVKISFVYNSNEISSELLTDYYEFIINGLINKFPRFQVLNNFNYQVSTNNIIFYVGSVDDQDLIKPFIENVKKHLHSLCLNSIEVTSSISQFETPIEKSIEYNINKANEEAFHEQRMFEQANKDEEKTKDPKGHKKPKAKAAINGEPIPLNQIPASDVQIIEYLQKHDNANFVVRGDVIKAEILDRKGFKIYEGVISDGKDSLLIKTFLNSYKDTEAFYKNYCMIGNNITAYGTLKYDPYSRDVVLNILDIIGNGLSEVKNRFDKSFVKRVELHAHTKMSTQDAVMDVEDYVKTAINFGHKALAVTDHNNIQALPDFYNVCKNKDITPIFGMEGNLVRESGYHIALNEIAKDVNLDSATYVVYDLETTGLSSNFNEIIEIAACKVKNGRIVDEFSTFVNPKKQIPIFITGLTHITNDDVRNAPSIEAALPEFKKFIGDSILVAHNATFDNSMLYSFLKQLNIFDDYIPTIDTLQLARIKYGHKLKKFNLKAVSKLFDVELEQHHRAIYDTRATTNIFIKMLSDLRDDGIKTYNQINSLINNEEAFKYSFPTHITILSKNRTGIINLNKIVSDSNTIHFYKEPRIVRNIIDKYRDGLIIGSACSNGEIFDIAFNKSEEELIEAAKFYDFLEVQPTYYYRHLLEKSFNKNVDSDADDFNLERYTQEKEELMYEFDNNIKKTIKKIINVGKQLGKLVVATGDVHHLNKEDVKLREIFIDAPQVGGGRHPLNKINEVPSQYFMNTEEMLQEFNFLGEELANEIVITNTNEIANMVEKYELFPKKLFAPSDDFMANRGVPSFKQACIDLTYKTAKKKYGKNLPKYVVDRIEKELNSIIGNNYASIYYISHLLVKHSKDAGYVVGSRGSVGSSLVATFMGITEVNGLAPHYVCPHCHFSAFKFTKEEKKIYPQPDYADKFNEVLQSVGTGYDLPDALCPECNTPLEKDGCDIPFETFLGFKGDKVPDIDLNFSGEYQNKAHEFCRELFGVDNAFRAGTISTVADLTAYGYVKNFFERKGIEARRCEIERISSKIVGVKRSTGQHPGGIVVVPKEIEYTDIIPVQYPSDNTESSWRTTHYDYHKFESNLLKLDILGHDDPTMIRHLMDFVEAEPDNFPFKTVDEIPLADRSVLDMFSSVKSLGVDPNLLNEDIGTTGLPEFGTKLAKDMLRDIRPTTVNELIKISGLSHGTDVWNGNAKDYLLGLKPGVEPIPFKDLIGCRDDIMVYLMGKDLSAIDAFKIMEDVRKGRGVSKTYEKEMLEHGVPDWYIQSCKLIKYMFPKAHAAAYVIMALRIGWFKVHRPLYYYAAFFSRRANAFDVEAMVGGYEMIKLRIKELEDLIKSKKDKAKDNDLYTTLILALEMTARGYSFKQINIEKSDWRDFKISGNSLYIPFKALDSLGASTAISITDARNEKPFSSKKDFLNRTKVNGTLFEKMNQMSMFNNLPDNDQIGLF